MCREKEVKGSCLVFILRAAPIEHTSVLFYDSVKRHYSCLDYPFCSQGKIIVGVYPLNSWNEMEKN